MVDYLVEQTVGSLVDRTAALKAVSLVVLLAELKALLVVAMKDDNLAALWEHEMVEL